MRPANEGPLLSIRDAVFRYPGAARPALQEVSLEVGPSEVFGLLGPNGAGKTSLLKLSAGLLRPIEGTVRLLQDPAASLSRREAARRAAYVPASIPAGFPMTVREFVTLGRLPHLRGFFESRTDRDRVQEALEFAGIAQMAERPYSALSSGEQKRVLLARAIAQGPRVFLLDEPTANLDIAHGISLMHRLRQRARQTRAAILASFHDLNIALQCCDRIVLLKAGRIAAQGDPESVMRYPTIRAVFECEVYIGRNELNGTLFMVPMAPASEDAPR